MSTKGTVTLTVEAFVPWDANPVVSAKNCCKASGTLVSSNDKKIGISGAGTQDFEILIYKHGKNTSLDFQIEVQQGGAGGYTSFIPIGIAFRQTEGTVDDGTGLDEFPESGIAQAKNEPRTLTVDLSDANEDATWDFFLIIQGEQVAAGGDNQFAIGIIDPRVRGSSGIGVGG